MDTIRVIRSHRWSRGRVPWATSYVRLPGVPGRYRGAGGFSLIELLFALSILGALAAPLSLLIIGTLRSQGFSSQQDELLQTTRLAMERMVAHTRAAASVVSPTVASPTGTTLELGGIVTGGPNLKYYLTGNTLWETYPTSTTTTVTTALTEQVQTLQVQRLTGTNGVVLIDILLRLQDGKGQMVELQTRAFPRNM
jgi:prepilin-type N-terminal cleavage/methylation domain-containing protein